MNRIPSGDHLDRRLRLWYTEELMSHRFSRRSIEQQLQKTYGISARQARRYIRAIRRQWRLIGVPPERRAELRTKMESIYERAMNRKRVLLAPDGEKVEVDDPDLKAAAAILRQLADLDGVNAPDQHEHRLVAGPQVIDAKTVEQSRERLKLIKSGGGET